MQYKTPSDDMKPFVERAQLYWDQIDVDQMQPIVHGPLPTEEEMAERAERLRLVQELQRQYEEQILTAHNKTHDSS